MFLRFSKPFSNSYFVRWYLVTPESLHWFLQNFILKGLTQIEFYVCLSVI